MTNSEPEDHAIEQLARLAQLVLGVGEPVPRALYGRALLLEVAQRLRAHLRMDSEMTAHRGDNERPRSRASGGRCLRACATRAPAAPCSR